MNGHYLLEVDGMISTHSNVNYSNVVFNDLNFTNNSPIINSQLNIYNNIMVMSNLSNSFATSVYSVVNSNNAFSNITFSNDWSNVGNLSCSNLHAYSIYSSNDIASGRNLTVLEIFYQVVLIVLI
jgi:hypothetical protein